MNYVIFSYFQYIDNSSFHDMASPHGGLRKDCVSCRVTLDLTKTRMEILKEAIDLARESDHISHAFADINCSLCVQLTNSSFKFFNTIDDLNNLQDFILIFCACFNL